MDELRGLLAAMGTPIGSDSRLNEDALERKLRLALGYAQSMPDFAGKMPVNPVQLPLWKVRPSGTSQQAWLMQHD